MNTSRSMIRTLHIGEKKILILLLIATISASALESCASSRAPESTRTNAVDSSRMPADPGPGLAPDHCRLVATVVRIDEGRSEGASDPCSKAPCNATIRVQQVLGYGSGFTVPLAIGNEILVHFLFTLGTTRELFPGLNPPLPGLQVGSTFEAELSGGDMPVATSTAKSPLYTVGHYSKR